jgi:hypothetical protein
MPPENLLSGAIKLRGRRFRVRDGAFHHPEGGAAVVFSVRPTKVFAHAKGDPFGATTHRF